MASYAAYRCDFNEGDLIDGRFRVTGKLGDGSYGNVYKVVDGNNRIYALKLLRLWEVSSDYYDELVRRFEMEYRVSHMDSDYFVRSHDYGQVEGNRISLWSFALVEICHSWERKLSTILQ